MISPFQKFSLDRERIHFLEEVLNLCDSNSPELQSAKFLLRRYEESYSESVRQKLYDALGELDKVIFDIHKKQNTIVKGLPN